MTKNGCHNRSHLRETAWVQSGWSQIFSDYGFTTRIPVMIEIPDPLSKHCQYQRDKKDDPKCIGCKELTI